MRKWFKVVLKAENIVFVDILDAEDGKESKMTVFGTPWQCRWDSALSLQGPSSIPGILRS